MLVYLLEDYKETMLEEVKFYASQALSLFTTVLKLIFIFLKRKKVAEKSPSLMVIDLKCS